MKKILLVLAEGFEFYEASVFIDVMGWNMSMGSKDTKLVTCGFTKEVKSTFNQKVIVDILLSEFNKSGATDDFQALAIPGGFKGYGYYQCAYREEFLNTIREFDRAKKLITSICVGSLPIGRSGVLAGRRGTVYDQERGIYQRELESYGAKLEKSRILKDDNIIMANSPGSGIESAFWLLQLLTNRENMQKVKSAMGF